MVEGEKVVTEFMNAHWSFHAIYLKKETKFNIPSEFKGAVHYCSAQDLERMSFHKSAPPVMGIVDYEESKDLKTDCSTLLLEGINIPGNLGTLIRLADWFGINQVVVSSETTDPYSPKVIAASMGSSARVNVVSFNVLRFIEQFEGQICVGHMTGLDINQYNSDKEMPFALVLGGESHGVSLEVLQSDKVEVITIPRKGNAESLNVGVAAGILLNKLIYG